MVMALGRDAVGGLEWNGNGVGEDDEMMMMMLTTMIMMERDNSERMDAYGKLSK